MASLPPALKLSKVIERSLACCHLQFSKELLPIVEITKKILVVFLATKENWLPYGLWWQSDSHRRRGSPPTHLQTSDDLHHTSILNSKQLVHLLKKHINSSWCANEVPVCKIAGIQIACFGFTSPSKRVWNIHPKLLAIVLNRNRLSSAPI
jgi:hypothetical protein